MSDERNADLRRRAEEYLRLHPATGSGVDEVGNLIEELHLYQAELSMQNEELQRAQAQTEHERRKYFLLFDLAPMPFLTLDENGVIQAINLAASELLGVQRSLIIPGLTPISAFLSPESHQTLRVHLAGVFAHAASIECELQLHRKAGPVPVVRVRSTLLPPSDGPRCCLVGMFDISSRLLAEQKLRVALEEKESLLREVHHRVKNNLQSIIHLISMTTQQFHDPVVIARMMELKTRTMTMALVYEQLQIQGRLAHVRMDQYLEVLVRSVSQSMCLRKELQTVINAPGILFDVETAMPCGLLVTELLTNALKYAFPEEFLGVPKITISLVSIQEGFQLEVRDNGIGLNSTKSSSSSGLGTELIRMLAQHQLGGTLEITSNHGVTARVLFPARSPQGLTSEARVTPEGRKDHDDTR